MTAAEQPPDSGRTSIAISWPGYQRLAALRRQVNASENKDLSLGQTVEWAIDRLDAMDLP